MLLSQFTRKLISSLATLVSNGIITFLVPRFIGVQAYGAYGFITSFFTETFSLLDSGSSTALFTKLSQRNSEQTLITFYWLVVITFNALLLLLIFGAHHFHLDQQLWPQISLKVIFLGFFYGLLYWLHTIFNKITDALRLTREAENIKTILAVIKIIVLFVLIYSSHFDLKTFFYFQYFGFIILILGWSFIIKKNKISLAPRINRKIIRNYFIEFWTYIYPLIALGFFSYFVLTGRRWVLQYYEGNTEQAYFTLANQLTKMSILFTTAIVPIFHREISVLFSDGNSSKIFDKVKDLVPLFYFISVFISLFAMLQVDNILKIIGDNNYLNAKVTIVVFLLYPIHQTYGQLIGTLFYATNMTKEQSLINIFGLLINLIITILLVTPLIIDLNLGSLGLAISAVISQIVVVNLLTLFFSKRFNFNFYFLLKDQALKFLFLTPSVLFILCMQSTNLQFNNPIIRLLVDGMLYFLFNLILIALFNKVNLYPVISKNHISFLKTKLNIK